MGSLGGQTAIADLSGEPQGRVSVTSVRVLFDGGRRPRTLSP